MQQIVVVNHRVELYIMLASCSFWIIKECGIMLWEASSWEIVWVFSVVVKSKLKHVISISTMYVAKEQMKKKK